MHNELAPGQHEISPIFALSNVFVDQKALCQNVSFPIHQRTRSHFVPSQKPFAGRILKRLQQGFEHEHWTKSFACLGRRAKSSRSLSPSSRSWRTPVTFMVTPCSQISNTLVMIYRLGAQEAPPAIISLCFVVAVRDMSQSL